MAIDSTISFAGPFVGNGQKKDYDFGFVVSEPGYLRVEKNDVALVYGTDYSVTLTASGGTVNLNEALELGVRLTIRRNIPLLQLVRLLNNSPLYPSVLERAFDHSIMISQQLFEELSRCVKMPASLTTDDSEVTAASLISRLTGLVSEAADSALSAKNAASEAAASSIGSLDFVCPYPETSTDVLHLKVDFSLDGQFVDGSGYPLEGVISVRTDVTTQGFYLPDENGELSSALPLDGMTADDAGKTLLLKIAEVEGLLKGKIYFWRACWTNGLALSTWQSGLLVIPAEQTSEDDGGSTGGDGGDTGTTVALVTPSMIPATISGLQLRTAEETINGSQVRKIYVGSGSCMDSTGQKNITSPSELSREVGSGLLRNSTYRVMLIRKDSTTTPDVDLHLYFDANALLYDVPWDSPAMFNDDFPTGYRAEASSTLANTLRTYNPYHAFDRVGATGTNYWRSADAAGLPQHVQMIFDTPKKINYFYIKGHNVEPFAKTIKFYSRDVNGNWSRVKDGDVEVAAVELAKIANDSKGFSLTNGLICYGVRAEVAANHTVSYTNAVINEFSVSGFEYRVNQTAAISGLPEGYSIYREIGTFRTDTDGKLLLGSAVSASIQAIQPVRGRVWVSPPFMPTGNSYVEFTHNLDIDPMYANADVILRCIEPEFDYTKGDFATNLQANASDMPIPFMQRNAVGYWLPGSFRAGKRTAYGFTTALNKDKWVAYIRIFY